MRSFFARAHRGLLIIIILFVSCNLSAQVVPVLKYVSTVSGANISAEDLVVDAAGNTYTTGSMFGSADFDPGPGTYNLTSFGGYDVFVSKLDAAGNFVWAKKLGGTNFENGYAIAVDAAGNVYTTGRFTGTADFDPGPGTYNLSVGASLYSNIFISKLDSNGDFVWALSIGSATEDVGESLAIDAAGNVHILGTFSNTVDFNPGTATFNMSGNNASTFILKLNSAGDFIWAKTFVTTYQQYPNAITVDASGNVYSTGSWYASAMDFDPGPGTYLLTPVASSTEMFISKLDINGDFVWAKSIGNQYTESGEDIDLDNSGNVLVTGKYVATVDFDPNAGVSNMTAAEPTGDIFILKLANDGTYLWSRTMGGVGISPSFGNENLGQAITSDLSGNIFVTGKFSAQGDFDPGPGVVTLNANSTSYTDLFISKFDASGNLIWATDMGASGYDFGKGIRTNVAGDVYIAGQSVGSVDFDPTPCVFNAGASFNAFVLKLSEAPPVPAPTITSFSPASGPIGTPVTITGTNFSAIAGGNVITFFNNKPGIIASETTSEIVADVPVGTTTGTISVTSNCIKVISTSNFTVTVGPAITSFTPTTGAVNTTVVITGTNFSATPANNLVKFNGTTATVTLSSATSITTKVPANATTGTITVTVAGNTATSSTVFTVPGTISISPQPAATTSVCSGTTATLTTGGSGTTNITYQWQFSTTSTGTYSNISNGSGYTNVTTAALSINTTGNFGAGYYKCRISGDLATPVLTNAARLIVNSIPPTPTGANATVCHDGSGGIAYLYATGGSAGNYRWYTVATGGTAISGQTSSSYSPFVTSTKTFYVAISNGACEGLRSPATATMELKPVKPTVSSNIPPVNNQITGCPGAVILSGPVGYPEYLWNPDESGGRTRNVNRSGEYSIRVSGSNGCQSEWSDEITVIIDETNCVNAAPVISLSSVSIPVFGKVSINLLSALSDADNNIDMETLSIVEYPQSGAEAIIESTGNLTIDYSSVEFAGADRVTIGVCDFFGECVQKDLEILVIGDLVIYNGISPNNDGENDFLFLQFIDMIEETKNNKVSIFNRWGDEVFSVSNYNNTDKVFKGLNKNGGELSSGTYFYKIEFQSRKKTETGYLTLKK